MKKFIIALAALSMTATPALAEHRGNRGGYEHRSGNKCGWLCGAIIGGVVVGALSSNSRNRDRDRDRYYEDPYNYSPPPRQYQYVCQNEYVRDYYGNYILDQYGRAIYNQRCWYQ